MKWFLLIVFVMLLRATCLPLISMGMPYAPEFSYAAMRAGIAGGTLIIFSLFLKRKQPRGFREWAMLALIGFLATGIGYFGMFNTVNYIPPGVATVISSIQPLVVAFLAWIFLGEHMDSYGKAGLFVSFLGIVLIAVPKMGLSGDSENYSMGILYIVITGLAVTVSSLLVKALAGTMDAFVAMGWQLLVGGVFLAFLAALYENTETITWSSAFLISLLAQSLLTTALAWWLWFHILEKVELGTANAFSYLVPLFAVAIAFVLNNERPDFIAIIGIAVVLTGLSLIKIKMGMHHIRLFANKAFGKNSYEVPSSMDRRKKL